MDLACLLLSTGTMCFHHGVLFGLVRLHLWFYVFLFFYKQVGSAFLRATHIRHQWNVLALVAYHGFVIYVLYIYIYIYGGDVNGDSCLNSEASYS